jgi:ATP-utilizing enzymes of ATP-grasp superfamily (probably carboligases)
MHASAYSYILFGEFMSMGRRIAREIKNAAKEDKLEVIIT